MMPGPGGPRPPFGGPFGRGPQPGGFRRNWDNPPDDKKADDKKVDEKKPAAKEPAKRPAEPKSTSDKKPEPSKKPEPAKKSEPEKKPAAPVKKEASIIDVEVLNSLRVAADELVDFVQPLLEAKWPTVSLSLVGSLLVDEKDRPAPPPPPPLPPDGPRVFIRRDGSHGGPSHGSGHSFGPWGHFDPERLKEVDPDLYAIWKEENDLEKKTFELGEQYRRTKDAGEREKLKKELADQVGKHFDVRQKKRELELKRFAEHLERMKASIVKRQEAKESIVKERVDELTGEDDVKF